MLNQVLRKVSTGLRGVKLFVNYCVSVCVDSTVRYWHASLGYIPLL